MQLKIKSETNFWSGLFFAGFGIAAVIMSRNYALGTMVAMGPGYFPTTIGVVLIITGTLIAVTGLTVEGEKIDRTINLRSILAVCAGLIFFGWAIERIGFVPALFGLSLASTLGGSTFNWVESLVLSICIVAAMWVVFVWALALPVNSFW